MRRLLPGKFIRGITYAVVLSGVITVAAAVAVYAVSSLTLDQRIAAVGSIFTAGAFVLAIVASVAAVIAYSLSSRHPILDLGYGLGFVWDSPSYQVTLTFHVTNTGTAPALNVSVFVWVSQRVVLINTDGWSKSSGASSVSWYADSIAIHAGTGDSLPPLVMNVADDDRTATVGWKVVADRTSNDGSFLLHPDERIPGVGLRLRKRAAGAGVWEPSATTASRPSDPRESASRRTP
jgi:hypothetical protein